MLALGARSQTGGGVYPKSRLREMIVPDRPDYLKTEKATATISKRSSVSEDLVDSVMHAQKYIADTLTASEIPFFF